MGTTTTLAIALAMCASVAAIIFSEDAKPSVYSELVCQLPDGSGGVCRSSSNCSSATSAEACVASGLVCCPSSSSTRPAAGVGLKSSKECEKSAQFGAASDCPSIEMIPGQNTAVPGQFPYLATLGFGNINDSSWLCTGVLVSESYVLTSSACLGNPSVGLVRRVRVGDVDLAAMNDDETVQQIDVDKVVPHPLYRPRNRYHNIALLHLSTPVKFSARVRPACLNTFPVLPTSHLIVTGFGGPQGVSTDFGTARYVDVTEMPASQCQEALPMLSNHGIMVNGSMLCAADEAGGRDSCRGDSGGPVQVRLDKPHCQFSVVGLSSFGPVICGEPGIPSVYVRVSEYLEWIESVVWP